jgi:hypothetical protein
MPKWLQHLDHLQKKLCSVAVLALLFAGQSLAWANEGSQKAYRDCIIQHFVPQFIPKNGDPSLLKFSEIRQRTAGAISRTEPTVKIVGKIKGDHGGLLHIIQKTGAHWFSGYEAERYAPQGDPNWFPLMGGTKTAYFFGFRRISANEMTAPDANEVSGAIHAINRQLSKDHQEPIGIEFYAADHDAIISDEEFLRRFAERKALPMAVDGPLAVHDLSYHLSAAFLPNQVLDHGARITKRLLDFVQFAKGQAMQDRKLQWLVKDGALHSLIDQRGAELDHLGNYTAIKSSLIIGELDRTHYVQVYGDIIHSEFNADGASPNRYLMNLSGTVHTGIPRTSAEEREEMFQFYDLVRTFIQKHPDPAADQGLGLSHEEVLKQIDEKRSAIAKSVMSFSQ